MTGRQVKDLTNKGVTYLEVLTNTLETCMTDGCLGKYFLVLTNGLTDGLSQETERLTDGLSQPIHAS